MSDRYVSKKETLRQSIAAFKQWDAQWRKHCLENKSHIKESMLELDGTGKGKECVCVAYGPSLGKNIPVVKEFRKRGATVLCVDKSLKTLLKEGIAPDYCLVCDANVPFVYCEGTETEKTTLLAAVTANPKWVEAWKGKKYFFVNKDNINSQDIYSALTDCRYLLPAASNVGNALAVIAHVVFRFDKIYLFAYDYSWSEKRYYGGEEQQSNSGLGDRKKFNMNHMRILDAFNNGLVSTSVNLSFSARWLMTYVQAMKVPAINCTGAGIVDIPTKVNFILN